MVDETGNDLPDIRSTSEKKRYMGWKEDPQIQKDESAMNMVYN
jgi:hypothetical protein